MKVLANFEDNQKLPSNSSLDDLLEGGFEKGCVTQIFGAPSSGKSNVALTLAVNVAKTNRKVIYIDTEGGISIDRIKQLAGDDFDTVASNIIVFEPNDFEEQDDDLKLIETWVSSNHENLELIVLDSAVALFRIEESKGKSSVLGKEMNLLASLARTYDIAVLVTNQIYASFDEGSDENAPVGGTILQYWSKTIVELKREEDSPKRIAILKRHRSIEEDVAVRFKITNNGIEKA